MTKRLSASAPMRGRLGDADGDTLAGLVVLAGLAGVAVWRLAAAHATWLAGGALLGVVAAIGGCLVRARVRDRVAGRADPGGAGVIIGGVRGGWWFARGRPFVIPWSAFSQHVLIDGPTGRGKTFTFVEPILRAHVARAATGVFYLDGKGDRLDHPHGGRAGVAFDHVFCPADPQGSARWNPLGDDDPVHAARTFAAALFPEAAQTGANFYEARAVFAITRVAPAMALTGFGLPPAPAPPTPTDDVLPRLVAAGVPGDEARALLARFGPDRCRRQLAWLAHRRPGSELADLIRRDAAPAAGTPVHEVVGEAAEVTPAALARVLFDDGQLEGLAGALATAITDTPAHRRRGDAELLLGQLAHDVRALLSLSRRERAAMLANLQNRLGHFLTPPFLELCDASDFRVADVCDGRRIAFLLPTGRFPDVAQALGRVALAQFRHAVLASTPAIRKVAVLDEFHNFVSPDFDAFLAQARSRAGCAVMALQSVTQLSDPRSGRDLLDRMLANIATIIVTPGSRPFDAHYWADAFGETPQPHTTYTYDPAGAFAPRRASVRVEHRDRPRFTPTQIAELPKGTALIQVTDGRTSYPATVVDVERA